MIEIPCFKITVPCSQQFYTPGRPIHFLGAAREEI